MGALQLSAASTGAAPAAPHDDPFGLHLEGSAAQATAARGVEGAGSTLPHLDTIQASFGRHDVSGISAHVDGAAARASEQLGAEAYATGSSIGFGSDPSLHTAAHEAAHVVQQRAGVALKSGVGESGDAYERHADLVADAVVSGRSAEALLDSGPGSGGSTTAGPSIQRQEKPADATASAPTPASAPADSEGDELRKAILEAAQTRLREKTEIVSEANIQDIRDGIVRVKVFGGITVPVRKNKPMKNYTTCIEFAGQTMVDGAKAISDSPKETQKNSQMLSKFMKMFNREADLQMQLVSFQKSIDQWDDPDRTDDKMDTAKGTKATTQAEIAALKAEVEKDPANQKAKLDIKRKQQLLKHVDTEIANMQKQIDSFTKKMEAAQGEIDELQTKNDAWIKPGALDGGARPKLGEYILMGTGSAQSYGVSAQTEVRLQKGSFKHIAVLESREPTTPPEGVAGTWEKWKTIDGGGSAPVGTELFVRMDAPYTVQWGKPGSNPWAAERTVLLGWIDADELVANNKEETVPPK